MKRIAILYSGSRTGGGVDTYLTNLFKYVDKSKVDLTLFALGEWNLTEKIKKAGCSIEIFNGRRFRPKTVFDISHTLKNEGFDLLVTQGVVANFYGRLASIFSRVPNLVTVHSDIRYDYENPYIRSFYLVLDFLLGWRTIKYITVSKYLKEKLVNKGISEGKIKVIYNGIELPKTLPEKVTNERTVIGSLGRLHTVKNYQNLIESQKYLNDPDVDLIIFGDGNEKAKLEGIIKDLDPNSEKRIKLQKRSCNPWEALREIDIYVQPSISEGFGLAVVEAQLLGLPVIVTPGGALPELVQDGATGLITTGFTALDIASTVKRYLSDPKLRESCAKEGQRVARSRFTIDDWVKQTIGTYLESAK